MPTSSTKELTDTMAERLRQRIASGRYLAGSFLPPERKLAAELGIARNTLRSALRKLSEQGYIARESGRGAVVCSRTEAATSAVVPLIISQRMSEQGLSGEAMALLGAALRAASRADMRFQIRFTPPDGVRELVACVKNGNAVGLLFLECKDPHVPPLLRQNNIPFVIINEELDVPGPSTRVDFWEIGRKAAEHFLGLGHRRLAVLAGPSQRQMYNRMLAGFRGRAAESEVYVDAANVVSVESLSEASRAAALEILSQRDRPTAVFCTRDVRAYGAYLAARELGLRVPEDLSLVGYDDITWPGQGQEFLTTFPEPTEALGGEAVRMLSASIQTGEVPDDFVITPQLVIRKSTSAFVGGRKNNG